VYDAGPAFGADADSGERVVAPLLRAQGIARLDAMVITHNDMDHAGGAASLLAAFEVGELRASLAAGHPLLALAPGARRCAAGQRWRWDGVDFAILHPGNLQERKANDLSCVLRISAGARSMLLTGDIERVSELELLERDRAALRSDVLLVPHHGSRSSSSAEFLAAVRPAAAVIPVGYRSRFGHPSPEVTDRLSSLGIQVLRTDIHGAVTAVLSSEAVDLKAERQQRKRYWHDAPP
jgi:competence protein ComEC